MTRTQVAQSLVNSVNFVHNNLMLKIQQLTKEESELDSLHDSICAVADQCMEAYAIYRLLSEVRSELAHAESTLRNLPSARESLTSNASTIDELIRDVRGLNSEDYR